MQLAALINLSLVVLCFGNDSPGFFLKVAKNVPRLGRRADPYLKMDDTTYMVPDALGNLLDRSPLISDKQTSIRKRMLSPSPSGVDREYSVVQPVNSNTLIELLERNTPDNLNFVFWKDFDRALQVDSELYAKVTSLGRKPDQNLKADLRFNGFSPTAIDHLYLNDLVRNGGSNLNGGNDYVYYSKGGLSDVYAGKYNRYDNRYNQLK